MEVKEVFLRTEFNYDRDLASDEAGIVCKGGRTKQAFAEEADINVLVKRFKLTGEMPQNVRMPSYGDYTNVKDFKSAMDAIAVAHEAFDAMPASIRKRFENDPGKFMEFVADEGNRAEAEKLGLVKPRQAALAAEGKTAATVVAPSGDVKSAPTSAPAPSPT